MIKIEITDPQLLDEKTLVNISAFLLRLAGHEVSEKIPISVKVEVPKVVPPPPMISPVFGDTIVNNEPHQDTGISPPYNPFAKNESNLTFVPDVPIVVPLPPKANTSLSVELDVDNMPWDNRIHARTKTKTADGKWKLMRGIDTKVVDSVSKELKKVMSVPKAPSIPQPQEDPLTAVSIDFPALMTKITSAVSQGKITQMQIVELVQSVGLPTLVQLSNRPDLVPMVSTKLDLMI